MNKNPKPKLSAVLPLEKNLPNLAPAKAMEFIIVLFVPKIRLCLFPEHRLRKVPLKLSLHWNLLVQTWPYHWWHFEWIQVSKEMNTSVQRSKSKCIITEWGWSGQEKLCKFNLNARRFFYLNTSLFPNWFLISLLWIYLKDIDEDHGVGHLTIQLLLLSSIGKVD